MKAKGGVFRERPLRKGPSRSTHLKLLGYRVTGAAGRRHVRAVKNPNSGETSTVKRTAKVVDEPASSEVQQTGEGVGSITRLGVVHPEEKSRLREVVRETRGDRRSRRRSNLGNRVAATKPRRQGQARKLGKAPVR